MKLIIVLSGVLLFCTISVQSENLEASQGEINKFEDAPENDEEVEGNWFELQHETIEQQADQPTSGEQFIAIRIGAAGSKNEVNPDLEGLVSIATQFLPSSYTFINVVSASREVVAGIKYELLIKALDENSSETLCDVRILERPWIVTNQNVKLRTLLFSNCSTDLSNFNDPKSDDTQYSINPIFKTEEKVMTDEKFKDMESLIIPNNNKPPKPQTEILPETANTHITNDEDALTVVTLSKDTSSFLDDFFSIGKNENKPIEGSVIENEVIPKVETPTRLEVTANGGETDNTFYHVNRNSNGEPPISSNIETSTQTASVLTNAVEEQSNGEVSQISCGQIQNNENPLVSDGTIQTDNIENIDSRNENMERLKRAAMSNDDRMLVARRLYNKLIKMALARLDRYDEDDNKRVLLNMRDSNVYGNLYMFDVTIADTKCSESAKSAKNCKLQIIDDTIKLCRFEIEHLNNDDIKLKTSECAPNNREKRQLGAARPVSESEQQQVVGFLNQALDSGDKPGFRLVRVIEATKQVVSGHLYKVKAEFLVDESSKVCNVKIWDRPWLGESAREVTFDCDAPARRKRQLPGGIKTIPNSEVENLLNEVISEGDYQSYRLIRIIESTRQVVAGSLYRIKAEFDINQSTKTCNIKIWDRPWLGKAAREVEFMCDEDETRRKRSAPPRLLGGITPLPNSEFSKVEELLNGALVGGDYQTYTLVRIIESSRQVVAGFLYRIKGEFEVEGTRKICNVKIWSKVSGEGDEITEFNCLEPTNRSKRSISSAITHTSKSVVDNLLEDTNQRLKRSTPSRPLLGGVNPLSNSEFSEVETLLNTVLVGGDYQTYKLVRIIESSRQVVQGLLYRIKAEFEVGGSNKICNVKIWSKVSRGGDEITEFICEADVNRSKRDIPGGITQTSESDKANIESLLNEVLSTGDYQSYRLVRIIESTKQIVSGTIFKIKAEFMIERTSKICNVKIWDRPWLIKSVRDVEFDCGESSRRKRSIRGGFKSIEVREKAIDSDFINYIETILKSILHSREYESYELIRVIDSTSEVKAGFIYQIKAEFSVYNLPKICNVKIWERESSQGLEVQEFICQGLNNTRIGGKSLFAENEQDINEYIIDGGAVGSLGLEKIKLESLLKTVLTNSIYKSYKLVRIIEFTKQNVEGVLYLIKAEFTINAVEHICNVKLWQNSSGEEKNIQELKCTLNGFIPTPDNDKSKVENLLNEILAYDDYQSYMLVKIIQSWQQTNVGINYKIRAELNVKGELKICDIKILAMFTKSGKRAVQSVCQNLAEPTAGRIISISNDGTAYVKSLINGAVSQGNYKSYKLIRIIEVTKQIVEGVLYSIRAQFAVNDTEQICNIKIWDKILNQRREVQEFICNESSNSVLADAHGSGATILNQVPYKPLGGSISATSEDDKLIIENILNGVLMNGDYQSYKLVRIIESTKQIVAGILYRIKAEFAIDGTQKICNVKIWEKVSNQGREVQEFICDEPSNIAGVGSHGSVASDISQKPPIQLVGGISATSEDDKPVIENILNGVLATGDYQSYKLVRIIESTKQIVAGILYRIKAEFAIDGTQKICNVKIWEKVSNLGREVQEFICDEPSNIAGVGSHGSGGSAISQEYSRPLAGGISATSEDDKPTIENILNGVLATGDYQSYKLVRIIESTKQIVAGILYRIKAEFAIDGTQKICNVKIWGKVSNQGREVQEFICDEPSNIAGVGSHGSVASAISQEYSRPLAGGISATSEDDKPTIENILNGVLATGDYQSYKLVRIIESTKQIVAGILYRIKAEFAIDGTQKICNVKIWEKVSNQGREVQEFICDEPSNIAGVGSHGSGGSVISQEYSRPLAGGISATSEDDKPTIENILNGVLATGDYQSYKLVRIIESTKQIVAGILYRIKAEFASFAFTQKICNVKIWEKVSNQGREIQEFICDEPSNIAGVGSHGSVASDISQKPPIQLVGGISATSEDDKPVIENILNGVLATGDYQSYKLVRIIESTKQIVAGILYRIKAEFAIDGTQKICNVKILEKVSNQGREIEEFICDEPSDIAGVGSHGSVASDISQIPPIQLVGGISAISEDDKPTIENILNGVLATGDYQSYKLVRIIESTKQIVAGILYRIKAEFAIDGTQIICNVKIWEKVSNQGREVQEFICDEPSDIAGVGSHGSVASDISQIPPIQLVGGISAISEDDKPTIENILNGVLATGDYQSYKLVRIIESTKQIVAGILYRIKAEFAIDGTQKICNVKIWEKVSNQGREVQDFICDEPSNIAGVGSYGSGGNAISQEYSRPLAGGISATSEDDKPTIENILNGVLATGDYQSYKLVRIIESTKQIVAGILYHIKAEFAIDGTQKICNVKIWEKVSNQGREVQEFICDEPSNIAGVGSHGSVASDISQEPSISLVGGISATSEDDKPTIENILNGVLATGDYQSYKLVRIIEWTKQIVAGILYRIKAEFAIDGTQKICNVKIWEKVSNQGREVQDFICDEPSNIAGVGSHCSAISQEYSRPLAGGISATSEDDKPTIENILNGVLATGDYQSYKLVRIIESTKQIVAGILYRIKAEFAIDGTQKICNVKIWEKVSNQGREVQEFICDEPSNIAGVGSHGSVASDISQEPSISLVGGISATSEDDKPTIENILNGVLATGDYQSYKLVRIIESTKQIVAGILYRIKAEFAIDGTQKICNVKIWEKVSNQGREIQEFICDEPSDIAGVGSHGSVASDISQKPSIQLVGGISATSEDDKPTIENILNGVLATGDYQSYKLVSIIESTKQIVAGILYRIKAEFAIDGTQKICNVKIWEKVSNQGREIEDFICDEPSNIAGVGSHGSVASDISQEPSISLVGGISATSEDDKPTIENILNGVLATSDYKSYKLVRIIESTKQIVAGILYRIKAEFAIDGTQKICNVKIWEKVSNQGREIEEFICDEPSDIAGVASHGSVASDISQIPPIQLVGGISAISEDDKPTIENILNGVLATGDYQSYKLVRIIESTKQIVAGILYRIKAEFAIDGTQKICNVKIWEKVSNQGREVQEFICDEPSNIAGVGSHGSVASDISQEPSISLVGGISATSEDDKPTIENILNGVLATGDYQSYKLVRIIEWAKQIVAGILYRIKAEFAIDGTQKICNVKIWEKVSNQGREVQDFICDEPSNIAGVGSHGSGGSAISQEYSRPLAGGISATSEDDKPTIENILNGVLATGDYQSYKLVRIIESTKQIVAGILYRIKAEFAIDGTQKICNVKIWEKVSNQGREVQEFICDEPSNIAGVGSHGSVASDISQKPSIQLVGGISATSEDDKPTIENILNGVLATGDYQSYKLVRIIESTKQIVAGILYRIKAEFAIDGTQKICNVKIWEKVSNQGREIQEFICDEPSDIAGVGSHGSVASAISQEYSRPLAGGISATSEDDKPVIENILNGVLATGDYQSYKLVRIIESTKQIVAGILYRIKAEFAIDGTQKICNVKIWEKVSNQGREVQEFICDEPSNIAGIVSNGSGGSAIPQKPSISLVGGISATSEDDKPVIENILNGVLATGDYQSYKLVRIIESTKQIVAGILYRIKAEFAIDGTQKICNVKIWEKVSNQGREVQEFICDEPSNIAGVGSHGSVASDISQIPPIQLVGGISATSEDDKPTIENILNGVLATGDYQSYKLVRIIESTKQIVAGILYRIKAEFAIDGTQKICNVKIWEKLSNQGREVQEFICDEPSNIAGVSSHGSVASAISQEYSRPLAGGISATSEDDKPTIENILNGVLATGDYQSYKLVRIIESTKQIVAGILYRIKAEFAIDGTQKICNVKIWEKVSNQGREVQEFVCDEPSNIAGVGSHGSVASDISQEPSISLVGGISATSEDDKPTIENILNGVLATGDYQSYKLVRIIESTKQIVAGILYRIKAEFSIDGTQQICNVKIWEKVSNQGREVQEFICDEPSNIVGVGSHGSVASDISQEPSISLVGGISATSEDDKPTIENILNGVLATGDYKSYKLVRIIESTKQIVAGILYRIKAEFAIDGTQKICNVKIWEKLSNQGREIQEFICDEPSNIAGVGSHGSVASDISQKPPIQLVGGISATSEDDKPVIENILNGVLATGDYQSYKLVRIIESTKQIVAGILYRIKAEFAIDGTQKICNVKIWEKVSNQDREVQEFICDEPSNIAGVGSHGSGGSAISQEYSRPLAGGISATSEDDKPTIENILNGVLATGDYQSYKLVRIIESTKQIVAGILYRIKAEFAIDGTQKICNVKIWEKVSNQGREIQEFICDEPSNIAGVSSHGSVASAISQEYSRPLAGGISATSEDDKPTIENILNGVLATGDYQSYKLVRIIESTKQIVAGILYRIKAEFAIDGTQKICNVKIWEKVSNQGREIQEFICDEPSDIAGVGSHGSVASAISQEYSRPLAGGISATSEDDKPVIENILNGVLATGDYQSYKLVRIIESTKQIVAGILYRIKAEFAIDGTQKICNVKIWEKVSNQGREVQEFICDEPSNIAGIVSNGSGGSAIPQKPSISLVGGISATSEDDKPVIENILNGVLVTGDYQSYKLVRIIESTKQIVAGILYRIKAEFAIDGTQKICNVKIWEKVSNQGREVQEFICDEPSNIAGVGSHGSVASDISQIPPIQLVGGISATSEDDKPTIENILNGVLATGDYQSYKLVRIIESTKQIVAGILYRIKAEFAIDGTQKICNVKIWEKVSNQGREVQEFICDEPSNIAGVGSHGSVASDISQIPPIQLVGGISATSEDDKPTIENILNGVLATGDYQSYKLVRIIESTKQIVAGILYRIKAEFAIDGTQKICNVKIWEKVSNQGREIQEFICDEPSDIAGVGSHGSVASAISQEYSRPLAGGISATSEDDKPVIENILNGVLATGDYQSYKLVRIIESTKQIVAGILYRIKAEFAIDGTQKICNVKIWEKVSNQGREVQEFICDEPSNIAGVGSHGSVASDISQIPPIQLVGGISATSEDDKPTIENILNGLLATGDYQSYKLVRIIESTKQIVAGILYRIKAEFAIDGTQKICNVKIWEKVSNQGREVQDFICDEPSNIAGIVSNGIGSSAIPQKPSISLVGGISATSEDDKLVIENILNGVLASGDYQSYKLVRIIEWTKQIVAGILYRIKAEFAIDGTQKICNVKIWEKVSNQGREIQEFICDGPSNIAGVGSHGSVASDISQEPSISLVGGISATSEDDKPTIENILNGVLATGDYQSYKLVRIIESTKQIVAGILYRIKAEFAIDGTQKICNVKIWEKVSNQGREIQEFICDEPSDIAGVGSHGSVASAISQEYSRPLAGGISATSEDDKPVIENILNGVLATGDYQSYKLVRIIESTKQIVAGILYRIKAEFAIDGTQKICNVKIWEKVSNQGREVQEFICDEPSNIAGVGSHGSVASDISQIPPIQLVGGISATSEDDKPTIENILNGLLATGDYQSYKLVRIIESTKQIVAGILYRIKAEFAIDGTQKICNVKIWEKVSNQGREVQEFICDGPSNIAGVGSHGSVASDISQEPSISLVGGISSTSEDDKPTIENILNGVLATGDYQSYKLVRIIESSMQVLSGVLYRIKAEFNINGLLNICNVEIWDRAWLGKSSRQVEFNCSEMIRHKRQVPGGVSTTSAADRNKVENILNEVLVGGDYTSYRLERIIESSTQIVSGKLYKIKAEFSVDQSTKVCDVKIWDRPWLGNKGGRKVGFECESTRQKRQIPGGSNPTSESDKIKIEGLLKEVLAEGDYQSYRLVRIIQGSIQKLTSGTLYYIEAIFLIDGDQRQCNVNINQRSRSNKKVYFNCEPPTQVFSSTIRGGYTIIPLSERAYVQTLITDVLSEGEYQSYRVVRIIEASSQVVSGTNYKVKAEFAVEDEQKICEIVIWVKLFNEEKEVTEFTCEQPQEQQISNTFLWRKTRQVHDRIAGGSISISGLEESYIESLLIDALLSGDFKTYRLVRIIESTKQTVAGTLYTIKAEFIVDDKSTICSITIWDRPWLGKAGRTVEFKECDGNTLARVKRETPRPPGSPGPVDESDYPRLEGMLNTALATGDQQNYRLARILHATKQLSSGWTYKIRGAFEVDGAIQRCNIKIWSRPWLPNPNTIESFKCDEHDEHTIRTNHDEKIKRTLDYYLHNNFTDNKVFEIYEKLYNKNYPTTLTRNMRLRIFKTNLRKIRDLNQHELGTATYGITEFADLTSTEYRMRTGLVRRTTPTNHISNPIADIPNIVLPREFDWRKRGVISEVKNQGSCGSCWAFSVIGNIEGLHAIKTGALEEYSEQELVDCDTIDNGCNGGLPDDAYKAIEQLGGLETEKDYPYTARRDHCSFNQTKVKAQIKGAVDLPKNETAIAQWLLQNGPVSIGINANAMQFYRGGVSHPWHVLCNKSNLDHGVLIVGFGVHDYPKFNKTLPYWIIKNSWGPRWGEQGYYRVYRGDNTCGVSEMVSSAVLE